MLFKKKIKEVSGSLRNKSRTRERIIVGIGQILEEDTFTGLSVTTVHKKLGVNPKLIYLYFENFDNLVNAFVQMRLAQLEIEAKAERSKYRVHEPDAMLEVILAQMEKFHEDGALKKLIHWSLAEKQHKLLKTFQESYMNHFRTLFRLFMRKKVMADRKRMVATLDVLLCGFFFLSMHSSTGGFFFGFNMSTETDRQRIFSKIRCILSTEVLKEPEKVRTPNIPIEKT